MIRTDRFFNIPSYCYECVVEKAYSAMPANTEGYYNESMVINYTHRPIFISDHTGASFVIQPANGGHTPPELRRVEIYMRGSLNTVLDQQSFVKYDKGPFTRQKITIKFKELMCNPIAVVEAACVVHLEEFKGSFLNPFCGTDIQRIIDTTIEEGMVANSNKSPITFFLDSEKLGSDVLWYEMGGFIWCIKNARTITTILGNDCNKFVVMRQSPYDQNPVPRTFLAPPEVLDKLANAEIVEFEGIRFCKDYHYLLKSNSDGELIRLRRDRDRLTDDIKSLKTDMDTEKRKFNSIVEDLKQREVDGMSKKEQELRTLKLELEREKMIRDENTAAYKFEHEKRMNDFKAEHERKMADIKYKQETKSSAFSTIGDFLGTVKGLAAVGVAVIGLIGIIIKVRANTSTT